ncbi:glycerophosphodiester phosphodiesterase [Bradyrhizobium sp. AUGA SZCCT0240]|jgi:glycerophosphoryl diester phosphodiesterase|uniref:glycerophosphodiester phosphodiesterase family protein n=1 Tax=unclassified Bradyrhizobium TaxID=2631580 RepID=UPI001BA53B62|nr:MULTISPECIES: glycerophosphodiester phosphodiesterase family protein [unclassified Bradyrhizobium]MBR1194601.1 glycerophosphodiester phosphodiesterase [Bradyrhizobium sp. AUGA SZCCT0158]MBR1241171.1 glycerophosphodiester phosphodiesterase [Bradyrhizobium sp. AUGA SZCCT0274]MBR1254367.1 glycerophosphodiester phosphodiesterase [Bradyrhizobium sp. AUGA SZCCT0240]
MVFIAGHRGARDLWPENSLLGFRNLRGLGVDAVEFDIHQSVDGSLVVIHDPLLDRTAHDTGPVGVRTLKQLTAIRLREAGDECIPTLDAVLDVYSDLPLELHIEIKTDAFGNPYPGIEGRLIEAVKRRGLERRAVLTCFVPDVLATLRRLSPQARVLASLDRRSAEMMGGISPAFDRLAAIPDCIVAVEKSLLTLTLPLALKVFGRERLGAWVTNEPQDIAHWLAQPVRQITTDRPDLAVKIRRELTSASVPS